MGNTTLAKGIYRNKSGAFIRIHVNGKPVDLRREADQKDAHGRVIKRGQSYKGRDTLWLIQERIRRQADADRLEEVKADKAENFAADVDRFLATLSGGHKLNTQGYMQHWVKHFAQHHRDRITDLEVQTAFASMKDTSTKIHIRRALIQFYDTLNGKSGYNPGRSLKKPAKPVEHVRDIPWVQIEAIFKALPETRGKARLMVMAYIGLPQKQISLLTPSDLRLETRELVVHPRRKGAGVSGRVIPLSDYGVAALEAFRKADAFGTFQTQQLVRTFKFGAREAGVTLPAGARPYDLRHSFLTELARGGADIRDIAELGLHATLEQAARYMKGAAADRATKTMRGLPRFAVVAKVRDRRKLAEIVRGKQPKSRRRKQKS